MYNVESFPLVDERYVMICVCLCFLLPLISVPVLLFLCLLHSEIQICRNQCLNNFIFHSLHRNISMNVICMWHNAQCSIIFTFLTICFLWYHNNSTFIKIINNAIFIIFLLLRWKVIHPGPRPVFLLDSRLLHMI